MEQIRKKPLTQNFHNSFRDVLMKSRKAYRKRRDSPEKNLAVILLMKDVKGKGNRPDSFSKSKLKVDRYRKEKRSRKEIYVQSKSE